MTARSSRSRAQPRARRSTARLLDELLDLGASRLRDADRAAAALRLRPRDHLRMTLQRVVLATNNAKKLAELRRIVAEEAPDVQVLGLADVAALSRNRPRPSAPSRAMRCSRPGPASRRPGCRRWPTIPDLRSTCSTACLASARRAGPDPAPATTTTTHCCCASWTTCPPADRTARFVCAMALVLPDGTEHVRLGEMSRPPRCSPVGHNGFGYDPLFVADGNTVTNGELEPAAKDAISHRGQAVRAIVPVLVAELRRLEPVAQEG